MSTSLDPTVVSKLRQFESRRFRIIAMRGLCAGIVTLLLCMAIVAFLDWGWVLRDNVRWMLSGSAYVLAAIMAWFIGGRKVVTRPAREEIASQVEFAEPELREQLLSAVELATDNPETVHDSPVFRGLLQGRVAQQMAKIRIGNLLPVRLMMKWFVAALLIIAALALLLTNGGPEFRTLAVRAMMPMANVDRVSRIQVEILEPTPHSLMIAKDETVAIVVATSGGDVSEAILETFVPGQPPFQQSMRTRTDAEFAANVHVEADEIQYRILAGDAVTKLHTISGRDRPRVVAFHKTYDYPEYSGLTDTTVTEDHGDVIVLEGTTANIKLDLDQPVSTAELRIDGESNEELSVIPLIKNDEGNWLAEVPVDENAIYKVHLVSAETGFENQFSPRYEIRPVPDLIPRAGFVDQTETNLLLPPNDILALKGMAEDDLPLETLSQEISVNGREWIEVPLEAEAASPPDGDEATRSANAGDFASSDTAFRINAAWNWDLLGLDLKTGDQITTRIVATDLKGNRGESVPLRIVVAAPEFDPERHATMEARAALVRSINRFARTAKEHKEAAEEIVKRIRDDVKRGADQQRTEAEVDLDLTSLSELAEKIHEAAAQLLPEVQETTRKMPAGADAVELDLVGELIASILHGDISHTHHAILAFRQETDDKKRRTLVSPLKTSFDRTEGAARSLVNYYGSFVSQSIFSGLASDMDGILQQQKLVAESPTQTFDRLKRQETVVLNQLDDVGRFAKRYRYAIPDYLQRHMDQLVDWTNRWALALETAMESEDKLSELQRHVQNLHREIRDRQRYDVIDGGLAGRLTQSRRDLDNWTPSLAQNIGLLSTAAHEEYRRLIRAADAGDSGEAEAAQAEAVVFNDQIAVKHVPGLDQLRERRTMTQCRVDADNQFAADAGMTHRAITYLMTQYGQGDPKELYVPNAFTEIGPAWQILEAGHDLQDVRGLLENLLQLERWKSRDVTGRTDHPRQWDAVNGRFEQAIKRLRSARIPDDIRQKIESVRWTPPYRDANSRITERRWKRDRSVSAAADLREIKDDLNEAREALLPAMAEARATIAKYVPSISEMAEQIAQQVRELEEKTTDAADAIEEAAAQEEPQAEEQAEEQLAQLEAEQEQINEQLDDLFEALVEDANQQNLLDEEERERARDADDSIAMVREPAQQMNRELQEAQDAPEADQQVHELAEAAEQQERTAQALEQVAEHFENLETGENVAETREELRQFERDTGVARQMDQQYEDLQPLEHMQTSTDQSLLEQLEEELQENPAMQQALSEIAEQTVEDARDALEDAAETDRELQQSNERSDQDFQQKKRELAEDLRELGQEASQLARQMVEQARSAAQQAKAPEAQKAFEQARNELNEAAQEANNSNEDMLLEDLAENAREAQEAIKNAQEELQQGKQEAAENKNENIFGENDRARQDAKRNLENQRKRFTDQLKREADQALRSRESEERREKANVRNAENNLKNIERQQQQAQQRLDKQPDNQGLKNAVAQAEARADQAKEKLEAALEKEKEAQQKKAEARDERNEVNQFPRPSLNDKNPAAQLAESMAAEAQKEASELQKKADEIASRTEFAEQLESTQQQLASSAEQQERVVEDVEATAEDLARASRHERRLGNEMNAEALQETSQDVAEVAADEATGAQEELQAAADSAEAASQNENGQPPDAATPSESENSPESENANTQTANAALAESEAALSEQADELTAAIEASQAAAAAAAEAAANEPQSPSQPQSGQPEAGQPQTAQAASQPQAQQSSGEPQQQAAATPANGGEPPASGDPQAGSEPQTAAAQPQNFTPEEQATGQLLAQALDELDRAQAAAEAGEPLAAQQTPSSLAQAALARAAQLAQQRAQTQQQSQLAENSETFDPESMPQLEGDSGEIVLLDTNRSEDEEWGKLRDKDAEDLTKGRREAVSEDYRKSVEAYFRVLAERAKRR